MKASLILALPALAVAAATPQVQERQLPLPSPFDTACLLQIPGITVANCLPNLTLDSIVGLLDIRNCPRELVTAITKCLKINLPIPGTK